MRARLVGALLSLLTVTVLGSFSPSQAQPAPGKGRLTFVSQTAWVPAGGEFKLQVRVDRPTGASNLEFALTLFPAVATRSEFSETLADHMASSAILALQPVALAGLRPEANGDVVLSVPIRDPALPRDPSRLLLPPRDGVYPLRVELRDTLAGTVVDRFVTHLLHTPEVHSTPKLGLAMVLPVHAGPALQPDGSRILPDGDIVAAMTQSVDAVRATTPFSLAPTPETVAALAASPDGRAKSLLASIKTSAAERPVLTGPYVPVNLAALAEAGLDGEVAGQLTRGAGTLTDLVGPRTDPRTWLATDALDLASLETLAGRGFDRVIAPEATLLPIPDQRLTITRPFVLTGRQTRLQAAAADAGLTVHFDNRRNQLLQAQQMLADLMVVYLDRPGDNERRGIVAVPPNDWTPSPQFLEALATGLSRSPIVEAVSIEALFASVPTARDDGGSAMVRKPVPPPPGGTAELSGALLAKRRKLDSLGSILGSGNSVSAVVDERLLVAQSSDLRTLRQREAYLDGAERLIDDQLSNIQMPEGRSITLTARQGEIPVTFQNRTGKPVKVVVKVQSDKLDFPRGTAQSLELSRLNTTERFPVVARTSGAFALRITLESPDGNLEVGRARITVRSTAASGVGLVLAMGAASFLAIWWGRNAIKGRRARGLVPEP